VPTSRCYRLNEEELKEKITSKTAMIIINSPNNPTGGIFSRKEIHTIADLSEDHSLLVLSDEIYDKIIYDGNRATSIGAFDQSRERTIIVNGFSKAYAMTGWRLGYAVAGREVIDSINTIQQATTTCAAGFVQKAGVAALTGPQEDLEKMLQEYSLRRDTLIRQLAGIPGITCAKPKGAFYVFPDFSSLKIPSSEIVVQLLEKEGVCSTSGDVFGKLGEGCIRLSYAAGLKTIQEASERIREFVERNCQQNRRRS
jgi:aminotransferase